MTDISEDQLDRLGRLADRLDNLTAAMTMPLSAQVHLSALSTALPEVSREIKDLVVEVSGENPWD